MASSPEDPVSREDTEALLEVRRELGLAYEKELVDSFAERIETAVAQRVDAQVAARGASDLSAREKDKRQLSLGTSGPASRSPRSQPHSPICPASAWPGSAWLA